MVYPYFVNTSEYLQQTKWKFNSSFALLLTAEIQVLSLRLIAFIVKGIYLMCIVLCLFFTSENLGKGKEVWGREGGGGGGGWRGGFSWVWKS